MSVLQAPLPGGRDSGLGFHCVRVAVPQPFPSGESPCISGGSLYFAGLEDGVAEDQFIVSAARGWEMQE